MQIAVLGTGMVGRAIASKLHALGHVVALGSRTPDNATAVAWVQGKGEGASNGTFAQVAASCEVAFLAVKGEHAASVLAACEGGLDGKVLLDLTNPLDFSRGFPPRLSICNDDSLGEQLQRLHPQVRVVKALNTLASSLMVDPATLAEPGDTFIAGEDPEAKAVAASLVRSFGHPEPVDMGGISAARGLEAWLLLWTRLYGVMGSSQFNLKLVRAAPDQG